MVQLEMCAQIMVLIKNKSQFINCMHSWSWQKKNPIELQLGEHFERKKNGEFQLQK